VFVKWVDRLTWVIENDRGYNAKWAWSI
jgi:hypothetical protein